MLQILIKVVQVLRFLQDFKLDQELDLRNYFRKYRLFHQYDS